MKLHVFKSLGERTNENESICCPKSALYAERRSSADINPKSYHLTAFELINPLLYINFLSFECKILRCRRLLRFDFVTLLFPVVLNGSPFEIPPILQSRTVQVVNIRCRKISESYKVMSIINDFSCSYWWKNIPCLTLLLLSLIVRNHGFNCLFMYVHSPKYEIFGHQLSEVNTLEMKNVHTRTHTFILHLQNFQFQSKYFNETSKYWLLILVYLQPGKVPFATVPNIPLAR